MLDVYKRQEQELAVTATENKRREDKQEEDKQEEDKQEKDNQEEDKQEEDKQEREEQQRKLQIRTCGEDRDHQIDQEWEQIRSSDVYKRQECSKGCCCKCGRELCGLSEGVGDGYLTGNF